MTISGKEVPPLVEGGKGIAVSNGESCGAWASAGGVGTFSGVNADAFDAEGALIPVRYSGRTRRERHEELLAYAIQGGISQGADRARDGRRPGPHPHERSVGDGRRGARAARRADRRQGADPRRHLRRRHALPHRRDRRRAQGLLLSDRLLRAGFRALWKRAYHKFSQWLGGVVYEDPWRAGGHNGLSNSEDPNEPQEPLPRVSETGLAATFRDGLARRHVILAAVWVGHPAHV